MCNTWYPAGLDYTLQSGDTWFFVEGTPLRPLSELITTYHNCVGMNTVMELVRHQSHSVSKRPSWFAHERLAPTEHGSHCGTTEKFCANDRVLVCPNVAILDVPCVYCATGLRN